MRKSLVIFGFVVLLAGYALADSIDETDAKKRDVPVDVILLEKRVAELEKQNQAILKRIDALEKSVAVKGGEVVPAASEPAQNGETATTKKPPSKELSAPVEELSAILNGMPSEFVPSDTDTQAKRNLKGSQRADWLRTNFFGKRAKLTITVGDVDSIGCVISNEPISQYMTSGSYYKRQIKCAPSEALKPTVLRLDRGAKVTVYGTVTSDRGWCMLTDCTFSKSDN